MAGHGRRALAVLTGALTGAAVLGCAPALAGTATVRYVPAGTFSFVVPLGVSTVHLDAIGARGRQADPPGTALGGLGDEVAGNLTVTAGATLGVGVGLGGGAGGAGAGDGGGASWISTTTNGRVLVAAGGGGAGGAAGGAAGSGGANGATATHGNGGGAGSTGSGGSAGAGAGGGGPGGAGFANAGGAGGAAVGAGLGGGGGGGGIYGGGGGGATGAAGQASGGGGGGASLIAGLISAGVKTVPAVADPSVTITYSESVAPAVTLDAPSARVAGAPALTGKASTGGGDETAVTVRVFSGAAASGLPARTISAAVGAGGAYSAPTAGLIDGTWTAQTVQRDAAGNTGTSAARTFTLDTTAPAVALTTPSDSTFTRNVTPTFAGTAGTAPGDASSVTVQVYGGATATGTPVRTLTAPVQSAAFTLTSGALGDGAYTAVARQADDLGNVGASAPRSFVVDTVAPSVTITAPAPDTVLTQGDVAVAAFACGDDRSGLESCASSIASGGALDTATPGAREVVVTARDRAGNTRTERRAYTVVARAADPGAGVAGLGTLPRSPGRPANGGLAIGTARAERRGRTLTITLAGTVVPAATGTVTARARDVRGTGAMRLRARIRKGRWHLTLKLRLSGPKLPSRVRLTITYDGDKSHHTTTLTRRLPISRGRTP